MNNVSLIGRLTKDPELTMIKTKDGEDKLVAKYILAVENIDGTTTFICCSAIDKSAEWIKNNVTKGTRIGVVGSIKVSIYKKQTLDFYKTEILVKEQYFA